MGNNTKGEDSVTKGGEGGEGKDSQRRSIISSIRSTSVPSLRALALTLTLFLLRLRNRQSLFGSRGAQPAGTASGQAAYSSYPMAAATSTTPTPAAGPAVAVAVAAPSPAAGGGAAAAAGGNSSASVAGSVAASNTVSATAGKR